MNGCKEINAIPLQSGQNQEIFVNSFCLFFLLYFLHLPLFIKETSIQIWVRGFPGGPVVKNPLANAGDTGLIPAPGRAHVLRGS